MLTETEHVQTQCVGELGVADNLGKPLLRPDRTLAERIQLQIAQRHDA
jgi:hypothetical protein